MKIKVKLFNTNCKFDIINSGDWIDLRASESVKFKAPKAETLKRNKEGDYRKVVFEHKLIPLGIAMKLPKGYEAIVNPRSSTFIKFGFILWNSQGVIDNSYCGNNDEWKCTALALEEGVINEGDRVCQFRIQLSQKATIWQKIKWLFNNNIKFEYVDTLNKESRGGFGSTGIN